MASRGQAQCVLSKRIFTILWATAATAYASSQEHSIFIQTHAHFPGWNVVKGMVHKVSDMAQHLHAPLGHLPGTPAAENQGDRSTDWDLHEQPPSGVLEQDATNQLCSEECLSHTDTWATKCAWDSGACNQCDRCYQFAPTQRFANADEQARLEGLLSAHRLAVARMDEGGWPWGRRRRRKSKTCRPAARRQRYVDWSLCGESFHSNLGGMGPDRGKEELRYSKIATVLDEETGMQLEIDLRVTTAGEYKPHNVSNNGFVGRGIGTCFGVINLASSSAGTNSVSLTMSFVETGTDNPVTLSDDYFTIADLDGSRLGALEAVTFHDQVEQIYTDPKCELSQKGTLKGGLEYCKKRFRNNVRQPKNPEVLTPEQRRRAVAFSLHGKDQFHVTFSVTGGDFGRNFAFSGHSLLVAENERPTPEPTANPVPTPALTVAPTLALTLPPTSSPSEAPTTSQSPNPPRQPPRPQSGFDDATTSPTPATTSTTTAPKTTPATTSTPSVAKATTPVPPQEPRRGPPRPQKSFDDATLSPTPSPTSSPTATPTAAPESPQGPPRGPIRPQGGFDVSPTASPTSSPTATPPAAPESPQRPPRGPTRPQGGFDVSPTASPTSFPTATPTAAPESPQGPPRGPTRPQGGFDDAPTRPTEAPTDQPLAPLTNPEPASDPTEAPTAATPAPTIASTAAQEPASQLTPAPTTCAEAGTCSIYEDPHIKVFDGVQISLLNTAGAALAEYESGDMWLVKSSDISIQGRYLPDPDIPGKNMFVRAIAVGGAFLNGNKLIVGPLEGEVSWNGNPILDSQTSDFGFAVGNATVWAKRSYHSHLVQDMTQSNAGVDFTLPFGVKLTVNRYKKHVNVNIDMPPAAGGQTGLCGNFNCNAADDALGMILEYHSPKVLPSDSLFEDSSISQ